MILLLICGVAACHKESEPDGNNAAQYEEHEWNWGDSGVVCYNFD